MTQYSTATVAGFTTYHEARGRTLGATWDDDYINAALLVATEFLDVKFGDSFIGEKTDGFTQEREWPRINAVVETPKYTYVIPSTEIPNAITNSVYELAWREASSQGSLLVDYTPNKYNSVSIDGAVSVDYRNFTFSQDAQLQIPIVEQLLQYYLEYGNSNSAYSGKIERV